MVNDMASSADSVAGLEPPSLSLSLTAYHAGTCDEKKGLRLTNQQPLPLSSPPAYASPMLHSILQIIILEKSRAYVLTVHQRSFVCFEKLP